MSHIDMEIQNFEKGVSLYLALMIMFILIAIGLGVSLIIVSQMKMIRGMGDSVIAFHAADTGIERTLYEDKNCLQSGCPSPPCYSPETTCTSPCRQDCLWLDNASFSGNLDTEINYVATHKICPDFNGDGAVNVLDLIILGRHFDETPASPNWDPKFDLNGDGIIDTLDADILSTYMGRGVYCSGYSIFESSGKFRGTKRAIEVIR